MNLYNKIKKYIKAGRCPLIKDEDGDLRVFYKVDIDDFLHYGYGDTEEKAINFKGVSACREDIKDDWKIIKTIPITELFPVEYEKGDKVRVIETEDIGTIEDRSLRNGHWTIEEYYYDFHFSEIEPVFEEEEDKTEEAMKILKEQGYKIIKK